MNQPRQGISSLMESKRRDFVHLWHRFPVMSVSELARRLEVSRPTVYSMIRELEARGDVRGDICDGTSVRLLFASREDYSDCVEAAFEYFALKDARYRRLRNSKTGDIDVPALTRRIRELTQSLQVSRRGKKKRR